DRLQERGIAIQVWDVASRKPHATLSHREVNISQMAFHPRDPILYLAAWHDQLLLWDFGKGTRPSILLGHGDRVIALALTPDGEHLVTSGVDRAVCVRGTARREITHVFHVAGEHVNRVCISPDGQRIVSLGDDD